MPQRMQHSRLMTWKRAARLAGFALLLGGLLWLGHDRTQAQDAPPVPGVVITLKGHTEMIYGVAFSPDGKYVITGSFDRSLKLWDAATGKEIKTFAGPTGHQNLVLSVAFSPDGQ